MLRPSFAAAALAAFFVPAALAQSSGSPFPTPVAHAAGGSALHVVVGDLDRDGALDLLAPNTDATSGVLLGDGAGAFSGPTIVAGNGLVPGDNWASLGDLDGDSILDVVWGSSNGETPGASVFSVAMGDGHGGFSEPAPFKSSNHRFPVALGDVNGDGILDMAFTTPTLPEIFAVLIVNPGDGFGGFGVGLGQRFPFPAGEGSTFLRDVNADGKLDAITSSPKHVAVSLGASGFATTAWTFPPASSSFVPASLAIGDANGDGALDVAIGVDSPSAAGTRLLFGDGAGGALPGGGVLDASAPPRAAALGDATGDGLTDLVTITAAGDLRLRPGVGGRSLGPPVERGTGGSARSLALADVDGDGRLDAVVAHADAPTLAVLVNATPPALGTSTAGAGTFGCSGKQGLAATSAPTVGNASFAIVTTCTPIDSTGLLLVADAEDVAGHDSFGIGVKLHVDLAASTLFLALDATGDALGYGRAPLPIPNAPSLAGARLSAQTLWLWTGAGACTPSPLGLSSSRLLSFVLAALSSQRAGRAHDRIHSAAPSIGAAEKRKRCLTPTAAAALPPTSGATDAASASAENVSE
ncbi:MAG TPA: VCBS repeat-containing protein [Planctomycetota bacterium]|nr:VCBS repeat-containing protein [Planctomycetota bacterium]